MRKPIFLLSALSLLSLGGGISAAAPSVVAIKAAHSSMFPQIVLARRAQIGTRGAPDTRNKWPYGGKNRAQRQRLNVGFFG